MDHHITRPPFLFFSEVRNYQLPLKPFKNTTETIINPSHNCGIYRSKNICRRHGCFVRNYQLPRIFGPLLERWTN